MQNIKFIQYWTKDYQDTLKLRNKVMRIPLGLDIYKEDLSFEKKSIIIGFFDNGHLLGVGVMSNKSSVYKIEYLCVDSEIQSSGIGGKLLCYLEKIAVEKGGKKICMDARVSAEKFYLRHGYKPVGDVFLLDYAPVQHIVMEKILIWI